MTSSNHDIISNNLTQYEDRKINNRASLKIVFITQQACFEVVMPLIRCEPNTPKQAVGYY